MIIRADHVSGLAFIAFGAAVIALSGDLPIGSLSFPASGFLPTLIAALLILLGASIMLRAGESEPLATLAWGDLKHAVPVMVITGAAIAAYTWLGFILTFVLMMLAILVLVERRNIVHALLYSAFTTGLTYVTFIYLLKAPLPTSPLGF
jgi:hypothetical protein